MEATTQSTEKTAKPVRTRSQESSTDSESSAKKRRWFQRTNKVKPSKSESDAKPKVKKSWGLLKRSPTDATRANTTQPASNASLPPKRKLFGIFDSLKLKPPTESKANANANVSAKANASAKSAPIPVNPNRTSSRPAQSRRRNDAPGTIQSFNEAQRQNRNQNVDEDDDEVDDSNRSLSKAERKRLRRQQQENRRVA